LDGVVQAYYGNILGVQKVYFSITAMPYALSSKPDDDGYAYYAPTDYNEWIDIVSRTVLHIKDDLNMPSASYLVWNEPETYFYWRGHAEPPREPSDLQLLYDYVALYANTWKAVKAADPTAKVGGPMTIAYTSQINHRFGGTWGTEEFVEALATFNAEHPDDSVTLDEIVWQDYDWTQSTMLRDGVAHLRGVLPQYDFATDTPQVVLGWNKVFNNPPLCETTTRQQRAAYIAANIIQQLAPGGERGLARAYLWPFDDDGSCPNLALITVPLPERSGDSSFGGYGEGFSYPAVTTYCKRPGYAVLQMLHAMLDGQFIRTIVAELPNALPPVAMASLSDSGQIMVIVANNSDIPQDITVTFQNLSVSGNSVRRIIRRIDDAHSDDCQGMEAGEATLQAVLKGAASLDLALPAYSVIQLILEP
jgi:hypothetical protein